MAQERPPLEGGVIFSLVDDVVWANMPGTNTRFSLGACDLVSEAMADFLGQCALAERLSAHVMNATDGPQAWVSLGWMDEAEG